MKFQSVVKATPALASALKDGLQALQQNDNSKKTITRKHVKKTPNQKIGIRQS